MIDRLQEYCDLVKPYVLSIRGHKTGNYYDLILRVETEDMSYRVTRMISKFDSRIINIDVIEHYLLKMKNAMDEHIKEKL